MIVVTIPDVFHTTSDAYYEFKKQMDDWLAAHKGHQVQWRVSSRNQRGWDYCFYFHDDDSNIALLFKLTWGGS